MRSPEVRTPIRVAAFVLALATVFVAALAFGRVVGPVETGAETPMATHGEPTGGHAGGGHAGGMPAGDDDEAVDLPGGLMVAQDGYALALTESTARPGRRTVAFTITDPSGAPLTDYEVEHEKRLHLIAVRRDFAGYQHVHPVLADDGTWSTDLDLTPGAWRLLADFAPAGGEGLTLGTDLLVGGRVAVAPPAPGRRTAEVGDYTVALVGDLDAGTAAEVTVTVSRAGRPVTDLDPYLGAFGHLVALREGDLAYLHVHPESGGPGPDVPFVAEVPSTGGYRLFFDFKHDGVVRTASFVVAAGGSDEH